MEGEEAPIGNRRYGTPFSSWNDTYDHGLYQGLVRDDHHRGHIGGPMVVG